MPDVAALTEPSGLSTPNPDRRARARIGIAYISNREDQYLPRCQESFFQYVTAGEPVGHWIIDDSAGRLGMAGAVQSAWEIALAADIDYLFHIEEDFLFTRPVDLQDLADILDEQTDLAQMCMVRQAWTPEEIAAGGLIPAHLGKAYQLRYSATTRAMWTEHDRLFSMNPCLIPRRVLELGWPAGPLGVGNEAGFTARCLAAGYRFAYYGSPVDLPLVEHIGAARGVNYKL